VIVVSDNSVLSCLSEIGELDLLHRLYGKITITDSILREAMHPGAPADLKSFCLEPPDWIAVVPDEFPYLEETGALDAGEASAITLAWQYRDCCLLILDERRGRKVASALGLQIFSKWNPSMWEGQRQSPLGKRLVILRCIQDSRASTKLCAGGAIESRLLPKISCFAQVWAKGGVFSERRRKERWLSHSFDGRMSFFMQNEPGRQHSNENDCWFLVLEYCCHSTHEHGWAGKKEGRAASPSYHGK